MGTVNQNRIWNRTEHRRNELNKFLSLILLPLRTHSAHSLAQWTDRTQHQKYRTELSLSLSLSASRHAPNTKAKVSNYTSIQTHRAMTKRHAKCRKPNRKTTHMDIGQRSVLGANIRRCGRHTNTTNNTKIRQRPHRQLVAQADQIWAREISSTEEP